MPKTPYRLLLVTALTLLTWEGVRADVILSLNPNRPLASVAVGETVTFSVNAQLTGGESLDTLTTKVLFTAGAFSLTPGTAGAIVPDPNDFLSTTATGSPPGFDSTDGSFFLPVGGNITTSGTFFTFRGTLLKPGAFTVAFDPASTTASDANSGNLTPRIPSPQTVTPGAAVPEPTTLLTLTGLLAAGALHAHRRLSNRCSEHGRSSV